MRCPPFFAGAIRTLISTALVGALTGCSARGRSSTTTQPIVIDFAKAAVGMAPPDFQASLTGGGGPVSWIVREDAELKSPKKAVVQESVDDTSYRFPVCVYSKVVATDVSVESRFKSISGTVDQAAGVILRYTPENYYIARANPLEDNIDIFKLVAGKRDKIDEVAVKIPANVWHTIRFDAEGSRLKVYYNGKLVSDKVDTAITGPGKVGFWTKADSVSAFTDLRVEVKR